ncbi:TNT domain-containing protein [Microbacterium sp. 13-71-7]|uniref:TNT domain-containing protein n=1 Tax=Microbacterium sp. 13-71-7 TaxID=1970399 RepID=UPI0034509D44
MKHSRSFWREQTITAAQLSLRPRWKSSETTSPISFGSSRDASWRRDDPFRCEGNRGEQPSGTRFSDRAIPPDRLSLSFSTTGYTVLKPLPADVVKGPIASAFEQGGGGVQYFFPKGIQWYIRNGYLG